MRMESWLNINRVTSKEYIAFKCLECGMISVFPDKLGDGNSCIKCRGYITPIGHAMVKDNNKAKSIDVTVKVNTIQLDEALEKIKELDRIANKFNNFNGV